MSGVDARYLGLTANQLAKIATDLKSENDRLRDKHKELQEFAARLSWVLDIDSEWRDPEWCDSGCMDEFKCRPTGDYGEIHCPAFARMCSLGIEAHVKEDE